MVGLGEQGVAWAPLDYTFDPFTGDQDMPGMPCGLELAHAYAQLRDTFEHTLAPDLPAGLNAAHQLYWMQHRHRQAWARTRILVPYPQYWAWWLSGVCASECTSLGCHTQLWRPQLGCFSDLAQTQGWARLFAPMRPVWDTLGPVRADLVASCGLPRSCQVHVGVHDSNACPARYLKPDAQVFAATGALTLVSSGTWTVLMAPGAPFQALDPKSDMLANVDVLGRATPTALFMGGRDFAALLDGAPPQAGSMADVHYLIGSGIRAGPAPTTSPAGDAGNGPCVSRDGHRVPDALRQAFAPGQRAALAALYCAQTTAVLAQRMWQGSTSVGLPRVVVEGPLANNGLYMDLLQGLLPDHACFASTDTLEGTARGAAALCHWTTGAAAEPMLKPVISGHVSGLREYHLNASA